MLLAEKKNTPVLHVVKHRELSQRITELTEDIEELKSKKATLLRILDCDDTAMADFKKDLASKKKNLMELEQHEQKYTSELDTALQQYHHMEGQAQDIDSTELQKARLSSRSEKENTAVQKLQDAYAEQFDPAVMSEAKRNISELLHEEIKKNSVLELNQRVQAMQQVKKANRGTEATRM